jgi:hypothetical protein
LLAALVLTQLGGLGSGSFCIWTKAETDALQLLAEAEAIRRNFLAKAEAIRGGSLEPLKSHAAEACELRECRFGYLTEVALGIFA